jgi:hypothetical protein
MLVLLQVVDRYGNMVPTLLVRLSTAMAIKYSKKFYGKSINRVTFDSQYL